MASSVSATPVSARDLQRVSSLRPVVPVVPVIPRSLERRAGLARPTRSVASSHESGLRSELRKADDNPGSAAPSEGLVLKEAPAGVELFDLNAGGKDAVASTPLDSTDAPGIDTPNIDTIAASEPTNGAVAPATVPDEAQAIKPNASSNGLSFADRYSASYPPPGVQPPRSIDAGIVFGKNAESSGSSPTLPPSASSTTYTHPTPLSDTTSPHSQTMYQGYGHVPSGYGSYIPQKPIRVGSPAIMQPSAAQPIYMNGAGPTELPYPPPQFPGRAGGFVLERRRSSVDILGPLQAHLLEQFNNPSYADSVLYLRIRGEEISIWTHSILVSRSPTLQSLLKSTTEFDEHHRRIVRVESSDPFITVPAVFAALRTCYGDSPNGYLPAGPYGSESERSTKELMNGALALVSAGHVLRLPSVAYDGIKLATRVLSLDNLERLLSFVLLGTRRFVDERETVGPEGNRDPFTELSSSVFAPYVTDLLQAAISFIIASITASFSFDNSALPSETLGGLPCANDVPGVGQRRPSINPRLSLIQFGGFPSRLDWHSTLISTILLSMPSALTNFILDRANKPQLMEEVLSERERRRSKHLQSS